MFYKLCLFRDLKPPFLDGGKWFPIPATSFIVPSNRAVEPRIIRKKKDQTINQEGPSKHCTSKYFLNVYNHTGAKVWQELHPFTV